MAAIGAAAIRAQCEYYFSAANLSRDAHLRSLADGEGFVALDALRDFPKLAALLGDQPPTALAAALSTSPLLDVVSDRVRARPPPGASRSRKATHLVLDANALIRGRAAALATCAGRAETASSGTGRAAPPRGGDARIFRGDRSRRRRGATRG